MKPCMAILVAAFTAAAAAEIDELTAKAGEGDVLAQVELAEAYATGTEVKKDAAEAARWFEKAAEQGDAGAQWRLGTMFLGGKGLRRDGMAAARWLEMAATQGRSDAQLQLARMRLAGAGGAKDPIAAYKWASLAAGQKDAAAVKLVGFLTTKMTPEELSEAKLRIAEYEAGRVTAGEKTGVPLTAPPLETEEEENVEIEGE